MWEPPVPGQRAPARCLLLRQESAPPLTSPFSEPLQVCSRLYVGILDTYIRAYTHKAFKGSKPQIMFFVRKPFLKNPPGSACFGDHGQAPAESHIHYFDFPKPSYLRGWSAQPILSSEVQRSPVFPSYASIIYLHSISLPF